MMIPISTWVNRAKAEQAFLMVAFCVILFDWLNGVLWYTFGSSFGLAAAVKGILLFGIIILGLPHCRRDFYAPLGLMVLMLLGPVYVSLMSDLPLPWQDLQLVAKAGAFLLALAFFSARAKQDPEAYIRWVNRFVLTSYMVLVVNVLFGLAGFGGTAYQPMDEVAQRFLGIKGFFISTNELSALLLVLTCWLLILTWQYKRWCYPLVSFTSLTMAALMLTKTGLFGTLLLIVLIPLLLTPRHFYRRHWRVCMLLLGCGLALMLGVLMNLTALLQWVGIYDKLQFAYQQRGIAGIILSSRDYYLQRNFTAVAEYYPEWLQLFGVGQGGVQLLLKKYFIEIDLFDFLLFYGLAGVLLYVLTFWRLLLTALSRLALTPVAAPVLLLNTLLLFVSLFAGHVLTSGMLWLPWALINGAVVAHHAYRLSVMAPVKRVAKDVTDERPA